MNPIVKNNVETYIKRTLLSYIGHSFTWKSLLENCEMVTGIKIRKKEAKEVIQQVEKNGFTVFLRKEIVVVTSDKTEVWRRIKFLKSQNQEIQNEIDQLEHFINSETKVSV